MKHINGKTYLTTGEAAAHLGISESHLRLLARTGKVKSERFFSRNCFSTPDLDEYHGKERTPKTGQLTESVLD